MTSPATQHRLRPILADLVITAVALLVFVWALWASFDWTFRAALFPRMVAIGGIGVALLHLIILLARPKPVGTSQPADGAVDDGGTQEPQQPPGYDFDTAGRRAWLVNIGWILAFFTSTYVIGLFLTVPFFTVIYLRWEAAKSWRFAVIYALAIAAVLYGFFDQLLHIAMPLGILQ